MNLKNKISGAWIIPAFFLILYIIFPNNNQGYDSYWYSISVRNGVDLFHPHHLLYNLLGFVIYKMFSFTGLGSMKILSLFNSLIAASTLMLIYNIVRHRSGRIQAALASILAGSMFTFWYCATSVEVNMIALFFLFLAFYYLIVKTDLPLSPWLVYLFLCVGMLFHQHIALAGIPILIYYIIEFKSFGKAIKPAHPGVLAGALIYLVVAIQHAAEKNIVGIYNWATSYAHLGVWGKFQLSAFRETIWGNLKLFFGGEKIREIFYAGNCDYSTVIYIASIILVFAGMAYLFIRSLRLLIKQRDSAMITLLALIIMYALFAFWWAPSDDGFWLYPAIILILFIFALPLKIVFDRAIAIVLIVLLLLLNITCEFIPASDKNNSYIYQGAQAFERLRLTSDDYVVSSFQQIGLAYEYYTRIQVPIGCMLDLPLGDNTSVIADYQKTISDARNKGRVFMFEDEIEPEPARAYLFTRFTAKDYEFTYKPFMDNLACVDSVVIHGRNYCIYRLNEPVTK